MMRAEPDHIVIAGIQGAAHAAIPADLTVGKSARACLPLGRRESAPTQAGARRSPSAAPAPLALHKFAPGDRTGRPSTGRPPIRPGERKCVRRAPPEAA
jgi:hypothetical protein